MIEAEVKIDLRSMQRFETAINNQLQPGGVGPVAKALKQWGVRYRSFAQERFDKFSKGGGDWPPLAESTIARRRRGTPKRHKKGMSRRERARKRAADNRHKRQIKRSKKEEKLANKRHDKKFGPKKKLSEKQKADSRHERKFPKPKAKKKKPGSNGRVATKKKKRAKPKRKVSILRDLGLLFAALAPVFMGTPGALQQNIPFGVRVGFGGPSRHGSKGKATIADIAAFHNAGSGRLPRRIIIAPVPGMVLGQMAGDMQRALDQQSNEG